MKLRVSMIVEDATDSTIDIEIFPVESDDYQYVRIRHLEDDNVTYDIPRSAIPELIQRLQAYVERGNFILPSDVE